MNITTTPTPIKVDPAVIRAVLVDLLTGRDHAAAEPEMLVEVGAERRRLASEVGIPSLDFLCDGDRLAVLVGAVGLVGHAYVDRRDSGGLRTALVSLAAITLTWLDNTPQPHSRDDQQDDEPPF